MKKEPTEEARLLHRLREHFHRGTSTYGLLAEGDHILIGLSGGKDSLALVELLSWRAAIFKPRFRLTAAHIVMENIPYSSNQAYLRQFCESRGVPFEVRTTAFEVREGSKKTPCFLCSWHRRKTLFALAQELGCNKIALGHHQDDILQTLLMNQVFQGSFSTMPPRLDMQRFALSIIRPLCMVHERDLVRLAELHQYERQIKNCPHEQDTNRRQMRLIYQQIEAMNPEARYSLWKSMHNVLPDYLPRPVPKSPE